MTEEQNFQSPDDDVEGHRMARLQADPQAEDDVEGHRMRHGHGLQTDDEDDVEGHKMNPGSAVQPGYDDDDVAGHVYR